MQAIKMFFFLIIISFAFFYYYNSKGGIPFLIPGDIYINKAGSRIYIPLGSSVILALLLFIILKIFVKF